jgi:hypothetical protein
MSIFQRNEYACDECYGQGRTVIYHATGEEAGSQTCAYCCGTGSRLTENERGVVKFLKAHFNLTPKQAKRG